MVLRNLDPDNGVCNGTRVIVKRLHQNIIEAILINGPRANHTVYIPRIVLISDPQQTGVEFKRRQFPVRLAFAMTINKAQGQTLEKVGIYLDRPVFSHGQLYVAMSRAKRPEDIKFLFGDSSRIRGQTGRYTANVVYNEVL